MKKFTGLLAALFSATLLLFAGASHAAFVPLDFSNYQGTLNDSTMGGTSGFDLGAGCTTTSLTFGCVTDEGDGVYSMSFTDVGTDGTTTLDAIVSFSTTGNGTILTTDRGIIPDYRSVDTDEPNNDFGFLYDGNSFVTMSGIDFTFTFYDGTGAASGTYADLFEVSELNLIVYDVDGESTSALGIDPGRIRHRVHQRWPDRLRPRRHQPHVRQLRRWCRRHHRPLHGPRCGGVSIRWPGRKPH